MITGQAYYICIFRKAVAELSTQEVVLQWSESVRGSCSGYGVMR